LFGLRIERQSPRGAKILCWMHGAHEAARTGCARQGARGQRQCGKNQRGQNQKVPHQRTLHKGTPPQKQSSKQMKCPTMRDSDANLILIWRGLIASSSSAGTAACHRRRWMPAGPAAQSAAALQPLPNRSDRRHHRATRQVRPSALALGLSAPVVAGSEIGTACRVVKFEH
jgi:hypothetical protein